MIQSANILLAIMVTIMVIVNVLLVVVAIKETKRPSSLEVKEAQGELMSEVIQFNSFEVQLEYLNALKLNGELSDKELDSLSHVVRQRNQLADKLKLERI